MLQTRGFAAAVLDALTSHICVVDKNGKIIAVNQAWRNFRAANSLPPYRSDVGEDYLKVCQNAEGPGSQEAEGFAFGMQSVLVGDAQLFQMEYPCHSPTSFRWFLGRVTPLDVEQGGAVISHENITARKELEIDLARFAATDTLTGLPNRRYFLEFANKEIAHKRRFGTPASVMMIDLDHFKAVNDTFGHAIGDTVLRSISRACAETIRQIDLFARFGGEEFVALISGATLEDALIVAEKLRSRVLETLIPNGESSIGLTASIGVTEISFDDADIGVALGRADAALYAAKHAGRNCVKAF
ncbi:diguanylate cyclase [Phyllobacterium sp. SYP-B3895]|uniref:sensor domain-containing diguanylate cyclase n=1 Tax=Phyllobacterium sp. SYP-B3895 TaxID=2663240 RepID=UPI001299A4F3|nr:sensor domain-containing diguanylate cyclase [Phyllobacterium sp. SYP-B3895]MRG57818.1 diguanylate cyclase [Phyllobacterium sp. SYP-B3895]